MSCIRGLLLFIYLKNFCRFGPPYIPSHLLQTNLSLCKWYSGTFDHGHNDMIIQINTRQCLHSVHIISLCLFYQNYFVSIYNCSVNSHSVQSSPNNSRPQPVYTAEGNNAALIGQFSGPETESPRQGYYTASEWERCNTLGNVKAMKKKRASHYYINSD